MTKTLWRRRLDILAYNRWQGLRFYLLTRIARLLLPDYRLRFPTIDWWSDAQFNAYLERFGERRGHNTDRRWMAYQLLRMTADLPGDTAECGVWKGAGSYVICKANEVGSGSPRTHFMFDSFEGLSAPVKEDGSYWESGDLKIAEDVVSANLGDCSNYRLMRGWIPSRFAEVEGRTFSFVHIDVDIYEPTRDSIEFFYPRLCNGGILLIDDYGFSNCPGATRAADEFLADKPEKMIMLPDGGGFIIKGARIAARADLAAR